MKYLATIIPVVLALTACNTVSADTGFVKANNDKNTELTIRSPSHVTFKFTNASSEAKCILGEDFHDHPQRPLLRVVDKNNRRVASYTGDLADRPLFPVEPSYVIVRAGAVAEVTFEVATNYSLQAGRDYIVAYSLPMTNCQALLSAEIDLPNGSTPFYQSAPGTISGWQETLNRLRSFYVEWSEVGDFVEFEETISIPENQ